MLKFSRVALLILLVCAVKPALAGLSLADYQTWQLYSGWRIRVIEFPGIHTFSREDVLRVMATQKPTWLRRYVRIGSRTIFYADDFAKDIIRVERFYNREGFPEATATGEVVADEKRKELKLKLHIAEGQPTILEYWHIRMGNNPKAGVDSTRWSTVLPIKIGNRLAASDVQASADTLKFKLTEIGYARAHVETEIETDSVAHTARLTFVLFPGNFCWIGQTRISGLKQVNESTARRELAYDENVPYNVNKLELTRKNLVKLETFTFVSVDPDTSAPGDTLLINIRTQEGNRYRVRLGPGYDTDNGARVEGEFRDLSFFGRGRRFTFTGTLAELDRSVEARLFWPHTPWHVTDLTLDPKWELKILPDAFNDETRTATTILSGTPLEYVNTSLSNEVGKEYVTYKHPGRPDSLVISTKSVETYSIGWDTRDNPLVPRKGHFIGISVAESGEFYRTDNRWWRVITQGRAMAPRGKFVVFAARAELGVMGVLHDSHVTPLQERFFLGGPSSVRGWVRDRLSPRLPSDVKQLLGGNVEFSMSGEIRRKVWGPVEGILFADAGNVWTNFQFVKPLDLYPAAGVGIAFLTPVGPVRVDFGYQLRVNPYHETPWAVSFSLGTPF